jgi:tripartite-type tricarboxylate transporter receptor subunit TctC
MFGVLAPAGTPKDIVERLNGEMMKILQVPEVKEQLLQQGAYALSTTPQQTAERIRKEIGMWAAVIQDAKITGD